jgi:hypothetical protein
MYFRANNGRHISEVYGNQARPMSNSVLIADIFRLKEIKGLYFAELWHRNVTWPQFGGEKMSLLWQLLDESGSCMQTRRHWITEMWKSLTGGTKCHASWRTAFWNFMMGAAFLKIQEPSCLVANRSLSSWNFHTNIHRIRFVSELNATDFCYIWYHGSTLEVQNDRYFAWN